MLILEAIQDTILRLQITSSNITIGTSLHAQWIMKEDISQHIYMMVLMLNGFILEWKLLEISGDGIKDLITNKHLIYG